MKKLLHLAMIFFIAVFQPVVGKCQTIKQVKIGGQIWMAQNADVERFRNGDFIQEAKTNQEWMKAFDNRQPAWCYYNNDPSQGTKHGKLYNWYAVNDPRGLAPLGWHVPANNEWSILIEYLGGDYVAGPKMKSVDGWRSYQRGGETPETCANCKNWNNEYRGKVACHTCKDTRVVYKRLPIVKHSGGGSNISGFAGLPSGSRDREGYFNSMGFSGFWWGSGNFRDYSAPSVYLMNIYPKIFIDFSVSVLEKRGGLSVRFIKDAGATDLYEPSNRANSAKKSASNNKAKVVLYTKYDAITPEDRIEGFKWRDCENKDFPYEFGCKNTKIGQMNECLFGSKLNGIFGSDLWEAMKDLSIDGNKKEITKEMYDKVILNCKRQ